jgi:hypothetical protein
MGLGAGNKSPEMKDAKLAVANQRRDIWGECTGRTEGGKMSQPEEQNLVGSPWFITHSDGRQ